MANLQLTFASALYDRMQPIYTGEVKPEGIDLNFIRIEQPRPIFDRMSGGEASSSRRTSRASASASRSTP
jgi:4,5-dihydroxyphthalate decarboxylase